MVAAAGVIMAACQRRVALVFLAELAGQQQCPLPRPLAADVGGF